MPTGRPEIIIRPLASVTYSPVPPPKGTPSASVMKKVTPGRGEEVPSTYFVITRVCRGRSRKVSVLFSPAAVSAVCGVSSKEYPSGATISFTTTVMGSSPPIRISPLASVV